jgi:hypothetical protein
MINAILMSIVFSSTPQPVAPPTSVVQELLHFHKDFDSIIGLRRVLEPKLRNGWTVVHLTVWGDVMIVVLHPPTQANQPLSARALERIRNLQNQQVEK